MYKARLTMGIEEEYMIVDPQTRELTSYNVPLLEDAKAIPELNMMSELLQCQIEVATTVCQNIKEAREQITWIRRTVAELATNHGVAIAAVGTHPFSKWKDQKISPFERYMYYEGIAGHTALSMVASSMHVHVGFGKSPEAFALMIDVYNQMRYILPHLLALSTSSPFWEGDDTQLKSYRYTQMLHPPMFRLPPIFDSYSDYENYIRLLNKVGGFVTGGLDATMLWWYVRPRQDLGTLEVRIADMCTTIDETISIAALIQTFVGYFVKLREQCKSWRVFPNHLISSNIWRAQKSGLAG